MKFDQDPQIVTGNFLKLKEGESILGVFRGEPHVVYKKWENNKSVPAEYGDQGAKFGFRVNFITKIKDQYQPVIWEQGAIVYTQLKEFNKDYPLESTIVKITRQGTGLDTTYSILPNPKGHIVTPELEAALSGVKLADLEVGEQSKHDDDKFPPPAVKNYAEELPF